MGNTNFQTIHQMGTAISDFVKQATGRDNVQNIDMDHITVAQNHRYEEVDVSGRVVSFQAGEAGIPFEKMVVQIKPVQDLHGYDSPWPAGGGKNLFDQSNSTLLGQDICAYGVVDTLALEQINALSSGTYTLSFNEKILNLNGIEPHATRFGLYLRAVNGEAILNVNAQVTVNTPTVGQIITNSVTFTLTDEFVGKFQYFYVYTGKNDSVPEPNAYTANIYDVQIESGSTATSWTPYSNICPITGWTMVNVYQSGQNMEDARVYRFTFPSEAGIVYGGTLDVITGEMAVTDISLDLSQLSWATRYTGNSNKMLSAILSTSYPTNIADFNFILENYLYRDDVSGATVLANPDAHDVGLYVYYNQGQTARNTIYLIIDKDTSPAGKMVYRINTPAVYQLAPQEITTLLGTNNIWADTGDIEVKFTNVKELY